MELVDFLRARLDEDAELAASGETWSAFDESTQGTRRVDVDHSIERVVACTRAWRGLHIARHDPARVLAEVEAKRALIDEVFAYEAKIDSEWGCGHGASEIAEGLCPETWPRDILALRLLARPFRAHPDFDPAWLDD